MISCYIEMLKKIVCHDNYYNILWNKKNGLMCHLIKYDSMGIISAASTTCSKGEFKTSY